MPYYNDVPYYYGGGAYSNHSSLMTGTARTPFHAPLSRFSPHLSTISESPLSHLHRFSPISVRSVRRVIDTADIDVSSPRILSHNGNPPRNRLRRDRPTIKIRSQALKDNPALREHHEKHEKSMGELLMEKFFIKDKKSDGDGSQQGVHLYHQINLDRLEDPQEREALQKRITRRFTRRRSSTDLQLDPEQIQREAAYAQVQAEVLDSLVAEEQAQIENEARRGTLVFRKGTAARGPIIERSHYANNVDSDTMTQEEEEAAATRIRKAMKKTKKKRRLSIDKLPSNENIDNGRSSISSEISTDSQQIKEDDESKSQMYKIEACNSAGDFSTIWVNMNSENERPKSTDKQCKENQAAVFVPRTLEAGNGMDVSSNDTDESETQVVLAVRKSYVKDPSRNSVYLTMRKPTEKLSEKLDEVNKLNVKVDEDQLTNGFLDVENNILGNSALKDLTDKDSNSTEPNCKIQMANDINKDIKALKKTVCKSKKTESLAMEDVHSISTNDDLWDKRDPILVTKNDMREIVAEDSSFLKKAETTVNPVQSNASAFASMNAPKNDSQMECLRGISEDILITSIKNDENQKAYIAFDNTKKTFDHPETDSTVKTPEVLATENSVISVGKDKLATEEDRTKISTSYDENTMSRSIVETEASDNVGKNRASGAMLTTNSATCRLPKLSKINTDRNNTVEAPKLSLRETTEYLADSPKSDQDIVGATAVALPEKKVNKTSNLAQVPTFNASKRISGVNVNKPISKIDATRHNDTVKLETKETTLLKETNDKMHSNEYLEETKLATDVKPTKNVNPTKTLKSNTKSDGDVLYLKTTDSSKIETKVIEATADALKETELSKTDTTKKINCIDVGQDFSRDLSSPKSKVPKLNSADLKSRFKAETLSKNDANESDTNSLKIGKDSGAFKTIKIGDNKSFSHNNADNETRILKKSISVDSSKLMNNSSSNKISKVFQQSISVDKNESDANSSKIEKDSGAFKIGDNKSFFHHDADNETMVLKKSISVDSSKLMNDSSSNKIPKVFQQSKSVGENESGANSSKIGKDSGAFKTMKIGDNKPFSNNDADNKTRVMKKSISVDSSKLTNDSASNKIPKVFQQSVSVGENESDANSSKIGKDSGAFKTMKIGDNKSFFHDDADNETRVMKKSISVDSSKLTNDSASNKIPKVFQQSVSVGEKTTDKGVSIKKISKPTQSLSKVTEKKPTRLDVTCNLQDENVVLSRSASTESIDFWSEIKAPSSPEVARSKQPNGFYFREATILSPTSKIETKMNLMNSKWKDNGKENEIDVKMSIAGLENSTVESRNVEKEKERIVSESERVKEAEITKCAKTTEIEKNVPKVPLQKKKNLSIDIKSSSSTVKKTSLKRNDSDTATPTPTPVEVAAVPVIKIVEAPKLSENSDDRKVDEEHEDPSTPTNELSSDVSLIRKISRWSNQDDLTNTDSVETPLASEETSLAASPSISPQSSKVKRVIKKKKTLSKKTPSEKSERGTKETRGNELTTTTTNQQKPLIAKLVPEKQHLAKPSPKTSPKSSPKNTPSQRPLDLIRMFYTTPSALLTATPRDLSKVRRAKIKRKRHHSRTPSVSSDSTGSTTSTATTGSTDENGSTHVELDDDSEHKRMNSTRSNDSGFDGSPRISNCDMACHKKCEKLTGNLCGLNQKLVAEALQALKRTPSQSSSDTQSRNSDTSDHFPSGRITPPAMNLPRFKKYTVTDFNFLKVLGKGSFGKVLLAELRGTECLYAVKCLKKDVVLEDDDVECTLIERKVLTLATRHPYLCHLFCTFQTDSHLFFVMEYLNGGDLMFHIQKSGRFPEVRARFYAAEIWSGLNFLHKKGIVYRDLKLDNVLLDFEGHIRIADFGMCKLQIFLDRTADTFCGTPDYMAPEIIKGLKYNQAVDWWSYGVLLYEMLTGQSPFSGCDEDELFWSICNERPFIPRYLSQEATDVLICLLEKDSGKRLPAHEIAVHAFFQHLPWDRLERRQLEPPFKPALDHTLDTKYFDTVFTTERPRLTPVPEQILTSMDQGVFRGFSYTNPNATD